MLPCYVVLDLETTGGNPTRDRITEIAAVRMEHGVETARWSTLVNPECSIPPFIESLTGIRNAMVQDAPVFADIAHPLLEVLEGSVFVAHNVRFDHGFVVNELARIGHKLRAKTLCTVRLSRALYPGFKSHGLDALMQRHGLATLARHRAMGDVDVVLQWLQRATAEHGQDAVRSAAQTLLQGSAAVPPQLETDVDTIPDTAGVYLFYGEGPLPLYIGKSVSLRKRVLSHFQSTAKVAREMRMHTEIRRVQWHTTAGELGALLLESRLVKAMQPVYNRQLRRTRSLCAWRLGDDAGARPLVQLVNLQEMDTPSLSTLYGVYRSKRQALEALRSLCDTHALCPQALGLESGKGPCFAHQIGQCKGVCAQRESASTHHLRLTTALAAHRLQAWPYAGTVGLREHCRATGRTDIHLFDQWCHLATVQDEAALHEACQTRYPLAFDWDTYQLLAKRLQGAGARGLIHLHRQR